MAARSGVNLHSSKKAKLGQNFLADTRAAEKVVNALGEIGKSLVVEIGPGRGALTRMLAPKAGRVIAIELDRMLATQLRIQYSRYPNVEVLEGDVLKIDFRTVLHRTIGPLGDLRPEKPERARLLGNLPYYITSDILLHLFEFNDQFDLMVIMCSGRWGSALPPSPAPATTVCSLPRPSSIRKWRSCSPCLRAHLIRRQKCIPACCGCVLRPALVNSRSSRRNSSNS